MAKPKQPLMSFGARGTIAKSLTFQKRGTLTIAREKPIPIDPKSPAQLAQRQKYKDAVAAWHALSPAEQEAWRGVCPGLTAYQCFMRSALRYVEPPIPIEIGAEAIDRDGNLSGGNTLISLDLPANASGAITSVEIWAILALLDVKVGIFYKTNGNTLKCRSAVTIGGVSPGYQTIPVSLAVEAGDYIGMYFSGPLNALERDSEGFGGIWYKSGDYVIVDSVEDYTLLADDAISLHGTGEGPA